MTHEHAQTEAGMGKTAAKIRITSGIASALSETRRARRGVRRWLGALLCGAACAILPGAGSLATDAVAAEVEVATAAELKSAITAATAGTVILLADGNYADSFNIIEKNGTAAQPIHIKAKNQGQARIGGLVSIRDCSYVILEGIVFDGPPRALFVRMGRHVRITRNHFKLQNSPDNTGPWIVFDKGRYNRFDRNLVEGRTVTGHTLFTATSDGDAGLPQTLLVDHNHFKDIGPENGDIGQNGTVFSAAGSNWGLASGYVTVEKNLFDNCYGATEIIYFKCSDNIVRENTFLNCQGHVSLRVASRCVVDGNFFLNRSAIPKLRNGGIHIMGSDHVITNNYFEGTTANSTGSLASLAFIGGDTDPRYGVVGAQVYCSKGSFVAHNTVVGNNDPYSVIAIRRTDPSMSVVPENITMANNLIWQTGLNPMVQAPVAPLNWKWEGNVFYHASGDTAKLGILAGTPGITWTDPGLAVAGDGLWRTTSAAVIGQAVASLLPVPFDMDGQARDASPDVGADEVSAAPITKRPLTAADVGLNAAEGAPAVFDDVRVLPYPAPNLCVQKFSSDGAFVAKWGASGTGAGQFRMPRGVAVDATGSVYVADWELHKVSRFDGAGAFQNEWLIPAGSELYTGNAWPTDVFIDASGRVCFVESKNQVNCFTKFSPTGDPQGAWGPGGSANGQFYGAQGGTAHSDGNTYIADSGNNRIQILDASGNHLHSIGTLGSGEGQFNYPSDVAVDSTGNIYVADTLNHRIQKFGPDRAFVRQWGGQGSGSGKFSGPSSVAVDGTGNIYVADSGNSRVQKFDANGNFLLSFGTRGRANGQFMIPAGLAVDAQGYVYVTDIYSVEYVGEDLPPQPSMRVVDWGGTGYVTGDLQLPLTFTETPAGSGVYVRAYSPTTPISPASGYTVTPVSSGTFYGGMVKTGTYTSHVINDAGGDYIRCSKTGSGAFASSFFVAFLQNGFLNGGAQKKLAFNATSSLSLATPTAPVVTASVGSPPARFAILNDGQWYLSAITMITVDNTTYTLAGSELLESKWAEWNPNGGTGSGLAASPTAANYTVSASSFTDIQGCGFFFEIPSAAQGKRLGVQKFTMDAVEAPPPPPPLITASPTAQNPTEGDDATFSVTATGVGPFTYAWYKEGTATPLANGGRISGATTNALAITGALAEDAGNYYVVITDANSQTTTSSIVTLTVTPAPISGDDSVRVVDWGGDYVGTNQSPNMTLAEVTAGSGLYMRAYSSSMPITPSSGYTVPTGKTGAFYGGMKAGPNANNYTHRVIHDTAGDYMRFQKDANTGKPNWCTGFVAFLKGGFLGGGDQKTLAFNATSSLSLTTVTVQSAPARFAILNAGQWYLSEPIAATSSTTYTLEENTLLTSLWAPWNPNGGTDCSLADAPTAANYTVSAATFTNIQGCGFFFEILSSDQSKRFEVRNFTMDAAEASATPAAPAITTQPVAQNPDEGGNATFSVAATGATPFTYAWYKEGTATPLTDGGRISGATTDTLVFTGALPADDGNYYVVITDANSQSTTSSTVALTVTPAPTGGGESVVVVDWGGACVGTNQNLNMTLAEVTAGSGLYVHAYDSSAPVSPASGYTVPDGKTSAFHGSLWLIGTDACTRRISNNAADDYIMIHDTRNPTAGGAGFVSFLKPGFLNGGGSKTLVFNETSSLGILTETIQNAPGRFAILNNGQWYLSAATTAVASNTTLTLEGAALLESLWAPWDPNGGTDGSLAAAPAAPSYTVAAGTFTNIQGCGIYFDLPAGANQKRYTIKTFTMKAAEAPTTPQPPTITTQPTAQNPTEGGNATFSVAATGATPFTYAWYKEGSLTPLTDGGSISGATTNSLVITGALISDAGNYYVIITGANSLTRTSQTATLTVTPAPLGPTITTPPAAQNPTEGDSATFSVTATGAGPFTYAWYKEGSLTPLTNGGHISGADTDTLVISGVVLADAGNYYVVITDANSQTTTSQTAALTVTPDPGITVSEGSIAAFNTEPHGVGPFTYAWYKEGTVTPLADGGRISGASTNRLVITGVLLEDAGGYYVVITDANSHVRTGPIIRLTVTQAPVITTQPAAQRPTEGGNALFNVTATGAGPLVYAWYKEGSAEPLVDGGSLSGAGTHALVIRGVLPADAGNYYVVITDANHLTTTSQTATLTVTPAPGGGDASGRVVDWSGTTYVSNHRTLNLTIAEVTPGSGLFRHVYSPSTPIVPVPANVYTPPAGKTAAFYGGMKMGSGTLYSFHVVNDDVAGDCIRSMKSSTEACAHAGFVAFLKNGFLNGNDQKTLVFNTASSLSLDMQTMIEASPARFAILNNGQWYLCAITMPATTNAFHLLTGSTLMESLWAPWNPNGGTDGSLADAPDAASYTVTATSFTDIQGGGYYFEIPATPKATRFTVRSFMMDAAVYVAPAPPAITVPPANQTVYEGANVTFPVTATGAAPLAYAWYKDGSATPLVDGGRISGATTATLAINAALQSDSGTYTVVVSNGVGTPPSASATLTVNPLPAVLPSTPVATDGTNLMDIGFTANWNSAADAMWYTLDVSTDQNFAAGTFVTGYENLNVNASLSRAVTGLSILTTYYYRVRAHNALGASVAWSNTISVTTLDVNVPPTITAIGDKIVAANTPTGAIAFDISDTQTPPGSLVLSGTSSNTTLVPVASIVFDGSGAQRTVNVTPAAGRTGTAQITIKVTDAQGLFATTTFALTVQTGNPYPEITSGSSTVFTPGVPGTFVVAYAGVPKPVVTVTGMPGWMSFDPLTGILSGTPPANATPGVYTITITADNGHPNPITQTFTLNLLPLPAISTPLTVVTLAGLATTSGVDDGVGASARFHSPLGLAADATGNIYTADAENHIIRKITPAGQVVTIAGQPGAGGFANGPASEARFNFPSDVDIDADGNLYVADTRNHVVRKITPGGIVSTFGGRPGVSGTSGEGIGLYYSSPQGLAITGTYLYVADTGNHAIIGQRLSDGWFHTIGKQAASGAADGAAAAARFNTPCDVASDSAGNVYVADTGNHTVRRITNGSVTTFAGLAGAIGAADGTGTAARFNTPTALAVDNASEYASSYGVFNVYVLDTGNHTVRRISTDTKAVTTIAGRQGELGITDGEGIEARFHTPSGIVAGPAGVLHIADTANQTIRLGLTRLSPVIVTHPQSRTVQPGDSVEFAVVATGYPAPTYQWHRYGVPIPGATESVLALRNVQTPDIGGYTVVVRNAAGFVTSNLATLIIGDNDPLGAAPTGPAGPGGGGGGACGWLFHLLLVLAFAARAVIRFRRT